MTAFYTVFDDNRRKLDRVDTSFQDPKKCDNLIIQNIEIPFSSA